MSGAPTLRFLFQKQRFAIGSFKTFISCCWIALRLRPQTPVRDKVGRWRWGQQGGTLRFEDLSGFSQNSVPSRTSLSRSKVPSQVKSDYAAHAFRGWSGHVLPLFTFLSPPILIQEPASGLCGNKNRPKVWTDCMNPNVVVYTRLFFYFIFFPRFMGCTRTVASVCFFLLLPQISLLQGIQTSAQSFTASLSLH